MINEGKEIKVYGTLINHTVDNAGTSSNPHTDSIHNDKLSYARQSYDDQFGENKWIDNYQDVINKRIKGITRKTTGNNPGTYINEDLYVDGDIWIKVNGQWQKLSLGDIINRIIELESLWEHYTSNNTTYVRPKKVNNTNVPVLAPGFYDSTVN